MDEFDLIRKYFAPLASASGAAGLRDDVAEVASGGRLIITADTIVEGVHFLPSDPLESVAAKLVRVNVSDILAKGGRPDGALLMLTWPKDRDLGELETFAKRLGEELAHWKAHLLGGDTTSTLGPLTLSLTLLGRCGPGGPIRRGGARAGEDLWVSGVIGDGWLGLQAGLGQLGGLPKKDWAGLIAVYREPSLPPLGFAEIIAKCASASIDVSDGLLADACHIAETSGAALVVYAQKIPLSGPAGRWLKEAPGADIRALLSGGDDYQTLFAAPASAREAVIAEAKALGVRVTLIGRIEAGEGVRLLDAAGADMTIDAAGWRHFRP